MLKLGENSPLVSRFFSGSENSKQMRKMHLVEPIENLKTSKRISEESTTIDNMVACAHEAYEACGNSWDITIMKFNWKRFLESIAKYRKRGTYVHMLYPRVEFID